MAPADAEAVGRLQELGFGRRSVMEAFLAADRDESMAASLLFQMQED